MSDSLAGLRVLVTRPKAQAEPLLAMLREEGAEPIALPMVTIAGTAQPEAAFTALLDGRSADAWLFTSANAVRCTFRLMPAQWPAELHGIGSGTARAGLAINRTIIAPEGMTSEQWLKALPPNLANRHWLVVTGDGGRDLLEQGLRRLGARVDVARVYRRVPERHDPAVVAEAIARAEVVVATSGELLNRLLAAATEPASHERLLGLPILLPSARVAAMAIAAGCSGPQLLPEAISDAAIVTRLKRWQQSRRATSAPRG